MAQEALEQAVRERGIKIRVETHGQIGIKNKLTAEEVKQTDAVIITADKDVHSEGFAGKRVIDASVSTGIKDAQQLIDEALVGRGTVLADNEAADILEPEATSSTNFGHSTYKDLINGVSHMLPFVAAGGVLIAILFAV